MNCSFHPEAHAELLRATAYYDDLAEGLGIDFAAEVHDAIQRIVDLPHAWPEIRSGIRRCMVRRFPFGIVYAPAGEDIVVLAVMHLHRRPGYWANRTT